MGTLVSSSLVMYTGKFSFESMKNNKVKIISNWGEYYFPRWWRVRDISNFWMETMEASQQWSVILNILKENNCNQGFPISQFFFLPRLEGK